jgi:phthiocerol/phenolphthiocerol synthesis type-I polyketide synthase C
MSIVQNTLDDAIAIVGASCKLPGDISNLDDLWNMVANKRDAITQIPENRISNINSIVNKNRANGKIVTKRGGFIKDIEYFDANFFQISAKEAEKLDPQQRLLLETSFNAIEDAGIPLEKLYGSKTGVFIGCWLNDFEHKLAQTPHDIDVYSTTGSGRYPLSGRLSFFYNLQGPSITVDTACSSSLVAIHLAMQSLKSGECNMAFAGAANAIIDSFISIGYSRSGLLSEYGSCYFGSKNPDGYVRSEGAAVVVLKRLQDAIKDDNQIYAILPASACNNDGASDKYMLAPSSITQQIMLEEAYQKANIDTNKVKFIEAHGTGTKAGDPSEINAIWNALSKNNRSIENKIYIGSVKTNIGHTESVAGFAGLFKTIMAMKYKTIPPNLHFYEPNPEIQWEKMGVEIPTEAVAWNTDNHEPLIAGINAFGITGTNAHVIVQSFEKEKLAETKNIEPKTKILPISANNQAAIVAYSKKYLDIINENNYNNILKNICFHKSNLKQKNAILFSTYDELISNLNQLINNNNSETILDGYAEIKHRKIAFVFPGQGSQWLKMGKELYHNNLVFKKYIDACEQAFSEFVTWKLTDRIFSEQEHDLSEIDIIQPALVAIEIALAKTWMHLDVQPYAVIGHSMGEIAAAYVANIISLEDAANIICTRSKLMKEQSGKGAMGYIALPSAEVEKLLIEESYKNVNIGVVNSPKSTVITGDRNEVEKLIQLLDSQEIFSRLIKVDVASHSNHMDVLKERLYLAIQNINLHKSTIHFQSTVDVVGKNKQDLDADYWVSNLRNTVQFSAAIQNLIEDDVDVFIEMSPNPVLTQALQENIEIKNKEILVLASLEKNTNDEYNFAWHIAQAYCNGIFIDWKKFYGNDYEKMLLPEYPWQKEYFWLKGTNSNAYQQERFIDGKLAHKFLQNYTFSNNNIKTHIWNTSINLNDSSYFLDHKVGTEVIFPAAAFLEILNAVTTEVFETKQASVENIKILLPLQLKEDEQNNIKIVLQEEIGDLYSCMITSEQNNEETVHCSATISISELKNNKTTPKNIFTNKAISQEEHYTACQKLNLNYGLNFQALKKIDYQDNFFEAIVNADIDVENYLFHPILLDACLQAILAPIYLEYKQTFVPYQFGKYLFLNSGNKQEYKIQVEVKSLDATKCVVDFYIFSDDILCVEAKEVVFRTIEQQLEKDNELWYELISAPIEIIPSTEKNNILVIHNNAKSELIYNAFLHNNFETQYLYINDYTQQALIKALSAVGIDKQTQIVFCIDNTNDFLDTKKITMLQDVTTLAITNLTNAILTLNLEVRLWCITNQALAVTKLENINPIQHQIPAFVRVLWNENIEIKPSVIDIIQDDDIIHLIKIIYQKQEENEVAIRQNKFYATRLNKIQILELPEKKEVYASQTSFIGSLSSIGVIDNLIYKKLYLPKIKADEVLVEVQSIGVNFMSLLSILGICPGKENGFGTLGIECVGIAKEVGNNIKHIKENDVVYGMAYHTLASHTIVNGNALCVAPNQFSVDELATIPAVFITVYYSLVELARIKKGDKVLIHAATGGVGLAAIQICKLYECEIFTTAGNDEKRSYLQNLGIDNIYDSRSINFYEEILEDTNGKGIDVVLNSLTGEAMYKSLELLASFGRFIEIGKKDIFDNSKIGLQVFQKSLSYFMVDAEKMLFEKPEILGELLQDISLLLTEGKLQALPYSVFNANEAKEAFRKINTSKHIGKIVINLQDKSNIRVEEEAHFSLVENASYLITGAFGGLGLAYTKLLLENGAKNLILIGRNQPQPSIQKNIEDWIEIYDANIQIHQADVTQEQDLKNIISIIPSEKKLKGIFHLAGLLDDATIANLTKEKYFNVYNPKVLGAIHLHQLTQKLDLDYFVLFSSSAVLFASPGQAAYVASNAYLDALAYYRKQTHLPAMSLQWSTISDVGLAAQQENRAERLEEEGIKPLTSIESLSYFKQIISTNYSNIGIFNFDIQKWKNHYPSAKNNVYFSLLATDNKETSFNQSVSFVESLKNIQDIQVVENNIEEKLKETISKVTKIAIDKINTQSTFKSLGIDSLMSIQLKNQLEKIFEINLSVTAFWTYATIKAYSKFLVDKLNLQTTNTIEQPTIAERLISDKQETNDLPKIETENTEVFEANAELDEWSKLLDEELNNL